MNLERARPSPAEVPHSIAFCAIEWVTMLSAAPRVFVSPPKARGYQLLLIAPSLKLTVAFYFSSCAAMLIDPPVTFIFRCQSL